MKESMPPQLAFVTCLYHIINAADIYQNIMELDILRYPHFKNEDMTLRGIHMILPISKNPLGSFD